MSSTKFDLFDEEARSLGLRIVEKIIDGLAIRRSHPLQIASLSFGKKPNTSDLNDALKAMVITCRSITVTLNDNRNCAYKLIRLAMVFLNPMLDMPLLTPCRWEGRARIFEKNKESEGWGFEGETWFAEETISIGLYDALDHIVNQVFSDDTPAINKELKKTEKSAHQIQKKRS